MSCGLILAISSSVQDAALVSVQQHWELLDLLLSAVQYDLTPSPAREDKNGGLTLPAACTEELLVLMHSERQVLQEHAAPSMTSTVGSCSI